MALFGGKVGRLKGRISQKEGVIKRLNDRIIRPKAYGIKSREEAERKFMPRISKLRAELQDLKFDLKEAGRKRKPQKVKRAPKKTPIRQPVVRVPPPARIPVKPVTRVAKKAPEKVSKPTPAKAKGTWELGDTPGRRARSWLLGKGKGAAGSAWKERTAKIRRRKRKRYEGYGEELGKLSAQRWYDKGLSTIFWFILVSVLLYFIVGPIGFGTFFWIWALVVIPFFLILYFSTMKKAIIFAVIISLFLIVRYTEFGSLLYEKTGVSIEEPLAKIKALGSQYIRKTETAVTGVGEWRNPYVTEAEEKKGVEIKIIKKDFYSPDETISIIGSGIIRALEEPAKVYFGCSMEGKEGKAEEGFESADVVANIDNPFSAGCDIEQDGSVGIKNVKFSAIYTDFKTKGKLKLWALPGDEQEDLKLAGIDPFVKNKEIVDTLTKFDKLLRLNKYRNTLSSYTYGPLILSLTVPAVQPLKEDTYKLLIGTDVDKLGWGGDLAPTVRGYRISLDFPSNVDSDCGDFYLLPDKGESQTFDCKFSIESIEEGLSFITIEAEIVYDYEFSKSTSVDVAKA